MIITVINVFTLADLYSARYSTEKSIRNEMNILVVLGGLGVPCSPRDPGFASSDPAEVDGFFRT